MEKKFVIFDKEMGDVIGIYNTFEGVMKEVMETAKYYEHEPKIEYDEGGETWYFTFEDADPRCVGHWEAYRVTVKE